MKKSKCAGLVTCGAAGAGGAADGLVAALTARRVRVLLFPWI